MEEPPKWVTEPPNNTTNDRPAPAEGEAKPMQLPQKLDIAKVRKQGKVELDFVVPGLLAGTVGSIVATGSTGKSMLSLQIAALVCGGGDRIFCADVEYQQRKFKEGRVVIFSLEDPAQVTGNRIVDICDILNDTEIAAVEKNLDIYPLLGEFFNIRDPYQYPTIEAACRGARLVLIDTLSRAHDAEENSNSEMAEVLKYLERLAQATGAAVVFLHHTSKASTQGGNTEASASRGASLITDNGRWTLTMRRMKKEEAEQWSYPGTSYGGRSVSDVGYAGSQKDEFMHFVKVSIPKANYSAPMPDFWLEKGDGGVLKRVELEEGSKKAKSESDNETTVSESASKNANKFKKRKG